MNGPLTLVEGCRWTRVESRAKIIGLLGAALAVAAAQGLSVVGMQLALAGAWVATGGLPLRWALQRCALVTPFAAMMAVFLAFERAPDYGPALVVLGKAYGSVLLLGMLVASTPVPELVAGLERLRAPGVLVVTASFTYRYAQLLEQEWGRMDRARLSRSGRGAGPTAWGSRLAVLFVRSWERGERVAAAMMSRGFAGRFPQCAARGWGAMDYGFAAGGLVMAIPLGWEVWRGAGRGW
ncbi:MAG: energy-coupling factor transporter transmembrane component T [Acidobacteria bacterium]|jgi:cobalt/nickel transport system permease protein|nr:energy-coupling factor transporter transmembrane component T [Acidobacteriota bacterium]